MIKFVILGKEKDIDKTEEEDSDDAQNVNKEIEEPVYDVTEKNTTTSTKRGVDKKEGDKLNKARE